VHEAMQRVIAQMLKTELNVVQSILIDQINRIYHSGLLTNFNFGTTNDLISVEFCHYPLAQILV